MASVVIFRPGGHPECGYGFDEVKMDSESPRLRTARVLLLTMGNHGCRFLSNFIDPRY